MNNIIKINSGTVVPVDTIRFIRLVSEEERSRIADRYGINGAGFQVAIQFADRTTKLARETLDEIRSQGVALVNIGADRHVVAANIKRASPFSKDEASKLSATRGFTLGQTFRSKVELTAGTVLSSATPVQIMERRAKAMEANSSVPKAAIR